jgi:hypothetical protein
VLCHSCYYRFYNKGTLDKDERRGCPKGTEAQRAARIRARSEQVPKKEFGTSPLLYDRGTRCSYEECDSPNKSMRFNTINGASRAGGQVMHWRLLALLPCGERFGGSCRLEGGRGGGDFVFLGGESGGA